MTGILAPPKHEKVEIEVNGSTYILRGMSDPEIAAWTRERQLLDAAMTRLRDKYQSDDALSSAATGEIEQWLKQQT